MTRYSLLALAALVAVPTLTAGAHEASADVAIRIGGRVRIGGAVRVRTPRQDDLAATLRAEGLGPTEAADGALLVPGTARERIGDLAFAAGIPVHELATEGASLEEVFLELTADAADAAEADA